MLSSVKCEMCNVQQGCAAQRFLIKLRLKVLFHELFLFQIMIPINAFIRIAFFFFKFGREIWLTSKVFKILVPETRA